MFDVMVKKGNGNRPQKLLTNNEPKVFSHRWQCLTASLQKTVRFTKCRWWSLNVLRKRMCTYSNIWKYLCRPSKKCSVKKERKFRPFRFECWWDGWRRILACSSYGTGNTKKFPYSYKKNLHQKDSNKCWNQQNTTRINFSM